MGISNFVNFIRSLYIRTKTVFAEGKIVTSFDSDKNLNHRIRLTASLKDTIDTINFEIVLLPHMRMPILQGFIEKESSNSENGFVINMKRFKKEITKVYFHKLFTKIRDVIEYNLSDSEKRNILKDILELINRIIENIPISIPFPDNYDVCGN